MNNHVRIRQIRRALLEALSMSGHYALPEETLWSYVDDLVKPPLGFSEKGMTLAFLRDGGFIRDAKDTLDPGLKQWVITELGRNLLASL